MNNRTHYTQIPHVLDDSDLSPHAFRLYCHIKRVAGDNGECWQSTKVLAEACKMSTGMVSKARQELIDGGFIEKTGTGVNGAWVCRIVDVWEQNQNAGSKIVHNMNDTATNEGEAVPENRSHDERYCSPDERSNANRSQYERNRSQYETKKNTEEYTSNEVSDERTETPLAQQFHSMVDELRTTSNKQAKLREIYILCYGEAGAPSFGYLGKVAKQVGGAGYLAHRLFELCARPPNGDVLAYIKAEHKAKKQRQNRAQRESGATGEVEWSAVFDQVPDYMLEESEQ